MKLKKHRNSIAAIAGSTVFATLGAVPAAQADADEAKDTAEGKCGGAA